MPRIHLAIIDQSSPGSGLRGTRAGGTGYLSSQPATTPGRPRLRPYSVRLSRCCPRPVPGTQASGVAAIAPGPVGMRLRPMQHALRALPPSSFVLVWGPFASSVRAARQPTPSSYHIAHRMVPSSSPLGSSMWQKPPHSPRLARPPLRSLAMGHDSWLC